MHLTAPFGMLFPLSNPTNQKQTEDYTYQKLLSLAITEVEMLLTCSHLSMLSKYIILKIVSLMPWLIKGFKIQKK